MLNKLNKIAVTATVIFGSLLTTAAHAESVYTVTSDAGVVAPLVTAESSGKGAAESGGIASFRGVDVGRRDAEAEFSARTYSTQEIAEFAAKYKTMIPAYARDQVQTESVIGADRRFRKYTTTYPERAIGQLTFSQGGSNYICTAWLIGKDTIATAGHCVHQGNGGVFSTNGKFYPGRNGASDPYGSCTVRQWRTNSTWISNGSDEYDYGSAKLNCTIGNTTGWFGWFWTTASLVGLPVEVSGYPGDTAAGTHYASVSDITVSETRKTRYPQDTAGGQSGSPVFERDRAAGACTGACANSIHAYGVNGGNNSGTRITQTVSNFFTSSVSAP